MPLSLSLSLFRLRFLLYFFSIQCFSYFPSVISLPLSLTFVSFFLAITDIPFIYSSFTSLSYFIFQPFFPPPPFLILFDFVMHRLTNHIVSPFSVSCYLFVFRPVSPSYVLSSMHANIIHDFL